MTELIHFTAIEADSSIIDMPEIDNILLSAIEVFDRSSTIFIFNNEDDAMIAKEILEAASLFMDIHYIIEVPSPNILYDVFEDYGLISLKNNAYVFSNTTSCFYVNSGTKINIEMGILQCEEHLIAKTLSDKHLYFFDSQLKLLISNISDAYDIEVSFLDLDKFYKNL